MLFLIQLIQIVREMPVTKPSVYQRIVDDLKQKIELGLYAEDERLLSCRELAVELGINPNTVQRAYSTLESEGYLYTLPKKGVYVAPRNKASFREDVAREKLSELKREGFGKQQLLALLNEIYGDDS